MEVSIGRLAGAPIIELKGEIDHGNAESMGRALEGALDETDTVVLLDLGQTHYMDSSGVSQLLEVLRHVRGQGWMGIINPNSNVLRLLQIVGLSLDDGVRIFSDRDQAAEEVRVALQS